MKRYIKSDKFFNVNLDDEEQLDRLKIPAKSVIDQLYDNVDPADVEVIRYLVDNKVIPTVASSPALRNNPYYDLSDKFIRLSKRSDSSRKYNIPYPGSGRFGEGRIYAKPITVYDDGTVEFSDGTRRDPYKLKPSTLKNYFWRGMW